MAIHGYGYRILEYENTARLKCRRSRRMSNTIVWIDENESIDAVVRPLEKDGHHIIRLRTIKAALDAVEQIRQADLILLEVYLPSSRVYPKFATQYPGKDLLQELRYTYQITIPTVVFTTVRNDALYRHLRVLGVVSIIRKPILPSQLKKHVDQILRPSA